MERPVIEFRNVEMAFGPKVILDRVNFSVAKGETLAVIGPSGTGKSTVLKLLIGLLKPQGGQVLIQGQPVEKYTEDQWNQLRQHMGMVFQYSALFDFLDVGENVAFGLRQHTSMSACVKTFPSVRNVVGRNNLSISIVRECIGCYTVSTQYQIYTFGFCFGNDVKCQFQFIVFNDRVTDFSTLCFGESVSHTTAKNQVVNFVHQVFNNTDFGRNFRATHDSSERTFDVFQNIINGLYFFLHQIA